MRAVRVVLTRIICIVLIAAQACAPVAAVTPYDVSTTDDSRLALVIGNSTYKSFPLDNPVNDAKSVAATLDKLGFEVMLANDLPGAKLKSMVRAFQNRARTERGTALVYYAGHAVAPAGRNILLPIDINFNDILEVEEEGVDVARMLAMLEDSRKHTRILIFDACRDNPYGQLGEKLINTLSRARSVKTPPVLAQQQSGANAGGMAPINSRGTVVAFSTAPGAVAEDGEGRSNSLFTAELVEALSVPSLTINQIFSRVAQRVKALTKGEQVPWFSGDLERDFVFNTARAATPQPLVVAASASDVENAKLRQSVEGKLAEEMSRIKRMQSGDRAQAQLVVTAQLEVQRVDTEREAAQRKIAEAADVRARSEAEAARIKREQAQIAAKEAVARADREAELARLAKERAAFELAAKQRAEELDRERKVAEAQKAREQADAERARLATIEATRVAELQRQADVRAQHEKEQRERLARIANEQEIAAKVAAAEANRLRQLAIEQAAAEKREMEARLALVQKREREAAERQRLEASRLALLAEVTKPVNMASIASAAPSKRNDADGNYLVRGVLLPANIAIRKPQSDVPARCAALAGAWGGARWDGKRSAEVWVESVSRDCDASVVYARGGDSVDRDAPSFERTTARIANGAVKLNLRTGVTLQLSVTPDKTLAAIWKRGTVSAEVEFEPISADPAAGATSFALEDRDSGVVGPRYISSANFRRALPMSAPGAKTISTLQLAKLLADNPNARLVDTDGPKPKPSIDRSVWLPDLGEPRIGAAERGAIESALSRATNGDKNAPLVVYQRSIAWGWLGYHGALRLQELGYTNVFWYRGGTDAWHDAGLPLVALR